MRLEESNAVQIGPLTWSFMTEPSTVIQGRPGALLAPALAVLVYPSLSEAPYVTLVLVGSRTLSPIDHEPSRSDHARPPGSESPLFDYPERFLITIVGRTASLDKVTGGCMSKFNYRIYADGDPSNVQVPLETGLGYAVSAIRYLDKEDEDTDEKFAILHLYAAIEVLLKVRLIQEHWTLVIADSRNASLAKYHAGDFKSVGAEEAVRRLNDICKLGLPEYRNSPLKKAEEMRNRQQHFGLSESPIAIRAVSIPAYNYLIHFIEEHLSPDSYPYEHDLIDAALSEIRDRLPRLNDLIEQRYRQVEAALDSSPNPVIRCMRCQVMALEVLSTGGRCSVCLGQWNETNELAEEYALEVLGVSGNNTPVDRCPSCQSMSLIANVEIKGHPSGPWFCFTCTDTWRHAVLSRCCHCGYLATGCASGICPSCVEEFIQG